MTVEARLYINNSNVCEVSIISLTQPRRRSTKVGPFIGSSSVEHIQTGMDPGSVVFSVPAEFVGRLMSPEIAFSNLELEIGSTRRHVNITSIRQNLVAAVIQ